jgi:hypothetical protein
MRYRPLPCTPAGDSIATFEDKTECDAAVDKLNSIDASLEEARLLYPQRAMK